MEGHHPHPVCLGASLGLGNDFLTRILNSVHEESIRVQSDESPQE